MKKIIFLHRKNQEKVAAGKIGKDTELIFLEEAAAKSNADTCLDAYSQRIISSTGQMRMGYNTPLIQKWVYKKLGSGKSFAEELVFDNTSLWYPIEYFLIWDMAHLSYEMSIPGITFFIDVVNLVLDEKKPGAVALENNSEMINRIIIKVCEQRKIPYSLLGLTGSKKGMFEIMSNHGFVARSYLRMRIQLRRIIGKLFCKQMKPEELIILTSDRNTRTGNETDFFWGTIVKELKKRRIPFKMIEYDRIDIMVSLKNLKRRYLPQKYDAQYIGTYYGAGVMKQMRKLIRFMKKKFKELDSRADFRKSFNYKGISFYELIRPKLKKIFLTYSIFIADAYEVTRNVMEKEKPRVVLIDHEKNYYARGLLVAANNTNNALSEKEKASKASFSFAFEGETVHGRNAYLTQVPVPEITDRKSLLWRPIADLKLLWSEHTMQWHNKRNFIPKGNLLIIGSPKYDYLKELGTREVQEIRSKYNMKKDERLVTVFTADLPTEEEFLRTILTTFMTFNNRKDSPNFKVIIKIHPVDLDTKEESVRRIIKSTGANAVVTRTEDCSKLIKASDFIITIPSTLIFECIMLDKRVVLFGSEEDTEQFYVTEGLIKLCKKYSEVSEEISKEISSSAKKLGNFPPELRKRFIQKYLYSDDGKGTVRAVDEIQKHLRK